MIMELHHRKWTHCVPLHSSNGVSCVGQDYEGWRRDVLLLFAEADPVDVPGSSLVSSKLRSSSFHFSAAIALVSVEHVTLAELDLV